MYQQSIFEVLTFNIAGPLKRAMVEAEKACGLSREQIVDRMNELAEQYGVNLIKGRGGLSVDTLEKWLNPRDRSRVINVKALPVFCRVVGSKAPIAELIKPLGGQLIDEKDARLLAWARQYRRAKEARQVMKKIEAEL